MSKIICNVCGTSYPEASTQCPICGCVRPADSIAVSENEQEAGNYTYVKGGRFSKSNVRKRNHTEVTAQQAEKAPVNKRIVGLAIVLFCLVVIVALMFVFILQGLPKTNPDQNHDSITQTGEQETPKEIPCTELKLSHLAFTMTKLNEAFILDAIPQPIDTTDSVKFESTDTKVVTVDDKSGKVLCVGPGKADIIVTCGEITVTCRITCEVEPVPTDPSVPDVTVVLLREKITEANYSGKFFYIFNAEASSVSADALTWLSDDPKVATVDQSGKVTAIAEGSTTIRALYNDVTVASCEIICDFTVPDNGEEDPEGGDPGTNISNGTLVPYNHYGDPLSFEEYYNAYSVTLSEDKKEWVGLELRDPNNPKNTVKVRWELDETYGGTCEIDEDGYGVTATSSEICRIVAKHGNTYYYIIIR